MNRQIIKSGLLMLSLSAAPLAVNSQSLIIDIDEVNLLPNAANQTLDISVMNNSGGNVGVNGIIFNLQVADGGPGLSKSIDGPEISGVDILTGTVFDGVSDPTQGTGQFTGGQLFNIEVATQGAVGNVNLPAGSSKIATVTFDTTGFFAGVFSLTADTLNQGTRFTADGAITIFPTLIDGSITVVPEPSETFALVLGGLGLFVAFRRFGLLPREESLPQAH